MPSRPTVPWPEHWYSDKYSIKCLVDGCRFTTESNGLIKQFEDLQSHCADASDPEHAIFLNMLGQRCCAMCDYRASKGQTSSNRIRNLFFHEKAVHGSDSMSRICGFIVLARLDRIDGRLGYESRKLAFNRMVVKLCSFEQPITQLLCHKSGLPHSRSNLQEILSTDVLRPDGEFAPLWWPVPQEQFLSLLRPDDDDPTDYQWGRVWERLRLMYKNGYL